MVYRRELDGLRALAVLLVLLSHSNARAFVGGAQGVDVFFVLSGYLITSLLPNLTLGEFWSRRFLRLFPALAVLVGATVVIGPFLQWKVWPEAAYAITWTRNIPKALGGENGVLLHTWSLAAEAQFYLVWPFLLPLLARWTPLFTLPALWLAVTLARALWFRSTGDYAGVYYSPLWHCAGLLLGAACAYAPKLKAGWSWLGAAMLGAHLVLSTLHLEPLTLGWALTEAATALIICAPSGLYRALSLKPLVGLGLISYGVYLWHFPIACYFEAYGWKWSIPAMLLGAIPLGALSYFTVERLRRWRPGKRPPVLIASPGYTALEAVQIGRSL